MRLNIQSRGCSTHRTIFIPSQKTFYNLKEQDITFGIVMLLAKKLSDVGFDIMVSRENVGDVLGTNASTS